MWKCVREEEEDEEEDEEEEEEGGGRMQENRCCVPRSARLADKLLLAFNYPSLCD